VALITERPINSHETDIRTRPPSLEDSAYVGKGGVKRAVGVCVPRVDGVQLTSAGICVTRD